MVGILTADTEMKGGANQERKGGKERQNVVSITDVERVRKGAGKKNKQQCESC